MMLESAVEQIMNKNRPFTGSIQAIEDSVEKSYHRAVFNAGCDANIDAALYILEAAQAGCLDISMQTDEVTTACLYLAESKAKVRPLANRFWNALAIQDRSNRFEITGQTLRAIRRQFGK